MKRLLSYILTVILLLTACSKTNPGGGSGGGDIPVPPVERTGESGISYQLLVYAFSDSNGDGTGDFNGITARLDYLKEMGVQAIWLSPIHPATSYHGYDVEDYFSVNPEYGTEDDFRKLLDTAHSKGIKIYLDFVLNHTSKEHSWFLDAKSDANSQYRDWYMISDNPAADVKAGKFPMMGKNSYNSAEWSRVSSGNQGKQKVKFTLEVDSNHKPKSIKVSKTDDIKNKGTQNSGIYLYNGDGQYSEFYSDYTLSLELETAWGVLVRSSRDDSWPKGTKWGAGKDENLLDWDKSIPLYPSSDSFDPYDILMPGMTQLFYYSFFGSYMPDINYGSAADCENSGPFKALCEAADKWIRMGVDGFRLDAVKHIYNNDTSDENPTFLKKFYDHCNATYKSSGHTDNLYMIGEHFSEAAQVAPYYRGIPAFFEFSFWWRLSECINNGSGSSFASTILGYRKEYEKYRPDFIAATKLSNHDEDRAGETLGGSREKMKLAAAVLLTSIGEPYIYMGEETGVCGSKSRGDENVRQPLDWSTVKEQEKDDNSVLSCYRRLGVLRDSYPALAKGTMTPCSFPNAGDGFGCWYREYKGQKILVIHNFGSQKTIPITNVRTDKLLYSCGKVTQNGSNFTFGQCATAIYLQ